MLTYFIFYGIILIMNNFLKFIQKTLNNSNERIVLQRFYLFIALFGFVIVSFLNIFENSISKIILMMVIAAISIFFINAIVWVSAKP